MLYPTHPACLRALAIAVACLWLGTAMAQPAGPSAGGPAPAATTVPAAPAAAQAPVSADSAVPTDSPASADSAAAGPGPAADVFDVPDAADPAPGGMPLPHDLSPWGMFAAADIVVKAVMVGLAFASVVTWTIGLAKALELAFARRRLRRALRTLFASAELSAPAGLKGPAAAMVQSADLERTRSAGLPAEGIKERVAASLVRIESGFGRRITRGTGVLATIGATAPFVGLFGTVWGIMNAFIGISKAQTTNLAVVAPGIAEALLATAIGLVAAIPAVIIYNHFARAVSGYRALLGDAAAETLRLLSRDLDRRDAGQIAAAPAPARPRRLPAAAE